MSTKSLIYLFLTIGSIIGGYIPVLWGGSVLSVSSIIFSTIGSLTGIWAGYKIGTSING